MSRSTQHDSPANTNAARVVLGLVLGAWFIAMVLAGTAGWFVTPAGQPPLTILVAAVGPIVLFGAVYAFSEQFRAYVRAGDPVLLTHLQSWRVLGGVFLVLMGLGLLPAAFALPAGWGDVAIGVTAPFVARAVAKWGWERAGGLFVVWQFLGILDLVVAVGSGASLRTFSDLTASTENAGQMIRLSQLPLVLVPAFAVPMFVILHLASLAQYRAQALAAEQS